MLKPNAQTKLMKNKIVIGGTLLLMGASAALADEIPVSQGGMRYDRGALYRQNEASLDIFGSASVGRYTLDHISGERVRQNTRLGLGLGLNYFFTRNLGIGLDAYSENTTGAFVDSASANLIFRMPIGTSGFAPYIMGGGGRQFERPEIWFGQFGGGFEYRFTPQVGAFLDARWVFPEETKYYGVARAGLRLAF
jgi:hypothetical protein